MKNLATIIGAIVLCAVALTNGSASTPPEYNYTVPGKVDDGWQTASLSDVKMDAEPINRMCTRILSDEYKNIYSVLIVKDGKLVFEEYFPRKEGDRREQEVERVKPREIHSATKSINSILIGIALDLGLIRSVDEKVSTFFPEYADLFADRQTANLRLKDLLTMTAGLAWDEQTYPYADERNDHVAMLRDPDPIRYALSRPAVAERGTQFCYNSGISIVLGQIVFKVSGLRADKFADRYLFQPLGISDYYWSKWPGEIVQTAGGLYMRSRDMAKLGQLLLDGGSWKGKRVVGREWVRESVKNRVDVHQLPAAAHAEGYGYQWWLGSYRVGDKVVQSFEARGRGGQFIMILPEQHMVAVFLGWNDDQLLFQPLDMMQRYVLPAALQVSH